MDKMLQNKVIPHKSQLNIIIRPWFTLSCIIVASILAIWLNYRYATSFRFSPVRIILGGLFSFVIGMLVGLIGGKWQIRAIEAAWSEISKLRGCKILSTYSFIGKTTYGKKVKYAFLLMFSIPAFIVAVGFFFIDSTHYKVILGNCSFWYVMGVMFGLYMLPIYLWARKLPD